MLCPHRLIDKDVACSLCIYPVAAATQRTDAGSAQKCFVKPKPRHRTSHHTLDAIRSQAIAPLDRAARRDMRRHQRRRARAHTERP